jgi:hypothetical protein
MKFFHIHRSDNKSFSFKDCLNVLNSIDFDNLICDTIGIIGTVENK